MRIEQLEYFIEIAKQKSINIASEHLHISQQTLSHSIKSLEKELNITLFERSAKGVHLTEKGKIFLDFAKDVQEKYLLLQVNLMDSNINTKNYLKGSLTIYTNSIFYITILPEIIKEFHHICPNVKLTIVQKNTPEINRIFKDNIESDNKELYIGLVCLPFTDYGILPEFLPDDNFLFQPIKKTKYCLCISRNSHLAKHKRLSIKTVIKQPIIRHAIGNNLHTPLYNLLQYYGQQKPNIILSTDNLDMWIDMIQEDVGIGFFNEIAFEEHYSSYQKMSQLLAIPIKETMGSVMGCLTPPNSSPIIRAFLNTLPQIKSNAEPL